MLARDNDIDALRQEIEKLQGSVVALEMSLAVTLVATFADRNDALVVIGDQINELLDGLGKRYSGLDDKRAFKQGIKDTTELISKILTKQQQ